MISVTRYALQFGNALVPPQSSRVPPPFLITVPPETNAEAVSIGKDMRRKIANITFLWSQSYGSIIHSEGIR